MQQLNIQNFWHVNPGGVSGTAGGILLIWKHHLDVEIMDCSINHINATIKHTSGPSWLFTGYYGSPYDTDSKLSSWKYSTQTLDNIETNIFSNKIVDFDLNDLGNVGCPFTWSNKRSGPAFTEQILDRGLANEPWLLVHPNSTRNISGSSAFIIARKLKDIKLKLKDRNEALKTATQVLREWQDIEEKFWKIKSRDQFIKLGDKNKSYFHRTTKCRIRRNKIDSIQDSVGNWIEDYHEIKYCFTKHFSKMAITESPEMNLEIINLIPTTITIADNNNLNRIPEDYEVKSILFSMAKDKAPGPDEFPPSFFQANWDIFGEDLIKMVQHFFKSGHLLKEMNSTFISLIPKTKNSSNPSHFRLISLCNTTYKIRSKLVEWKFLITIIGKIGFNSDWCNKIMQCISTTSTVVLINGSPDKFFNPSRGMRQGDTLYPYLFLFCMEALYRTLSHVEDLGIISGVQICKNDPSINHLLFADDCMVFCKANLSEAQNLKDILNLFGNTSGQLINFRKSGVFFSKNINPALMPNICNLLGVQALPINDKYLGSPLFTHKSIIQSFKPDVEKMKINLSSWKNSPLNPAGREVVIKFVTSTASIYQMNCFRIPKKICQDKNKLQRDFFWGKKLENPTGYYPKAWTAICKPKDIGGLGFMNMKLFNSAMITKIGWRMEQDKDSLWYQLMDAKYVLGRNVLNMDTKAKDGDSWIWKGILEGIQNIQQHCVWRIGNGNKINIWEDHWLPNSTDKLSKPANCPNNTQFLAHLMTDQKEWNLQFIQQLFSPDITQAITNLDIHPGKKTTYTGISTAQENSLSKLCTKPK
ncbi:uncharacterized protein LOC113280088 [Papaver somniferum]|uniref:uncharacterized protein LOC113280088 n=1 Tax=Papaver somniferum TaxID=3469 RepID=UPI000E6FA8E8|nr:uncharacterized protein LOC113280088 [Papaver somniferum]